jgi:hypothetical protein
MNSTQALNSIHESQVIDKIMEADAIKVNRTEFFEKYFFDKNEFFDVRSELFDDGLTKDEVEDLLEKTVLTGFFVNDNVTEYDFSLNDLLKGKVLEDGSISVPFGDEEVMDYILTCYKIIT